MFEEGQYVEVRGQRWQILEVRPFEDSTLLNLYGVDEQNKGKTANLFDTIDEIKPIGSKDLKLPDRPGLYPNWKSIHDSILFSLVHNREILASINYGRLSIEKYQLIPVKKALKKPIVRFLIADDTGLGKTIEAGLLMMELISRGRGKKIMIVTPAALQDQWKDEMSEKFNMDFTIYDSEAIQEKISEIPVGDNPWQYNEKIITSIDYVKRDDIKKLLKNIEWDLVIVDEAHYLSKTNLSSDRWRFGEFIKDKTENLIFLTATPHNGYSQSFFSLIQMLNEAVIPDLSKPDRDKATEYYTRRLKNQIYVDGKRKFTDRLVQNVPDLKLNSHEQEIYEEICEFAKKRWRLAKKDNRQMAEAFAMVVLKKRLLSSFEALKISLNNLLETAEPEEYNVNSERSNFRAYKDGLATEKQSEAIEKKLIRSISNRDKNKIKKLLDKIDVVISHGDSKKKRLLKLLDGVFQSDPTFKVIIFTEYRDTKSALKKYLESNGYVGKIAEIDGSNSRRQRIDAEKFFSQKEVRLLIATDAASEGLNFQNYSHIVIHNELPWNPNRLEQRNGRVDRWGQTNQVRVYNMLYENTFAYTIFQRLQEKIEMIKKDLGSVSSVIGLTDQDQLNDLIMIESDDGADEGSLMQSLNDYFDELETKKHAFSDLNQEKFSSEEDKQINEIIDYSKKYLSSEKSIRDFIIRAIKNNQGHIDEVEKNIFRIKVPFRFRRIGIEDEYTGTFSREIACALNNKELNFFDLNHILVKEIVKIYRSSLYSGTNQIDRVSFIKSEKEGILYTFLVRYTNGKREVVEEQIIPVFINTDGQVEKFDYGMGLFYGEHNFPKEKVNWREIIEKYSSNYEKLLESAKSGCDSFRKEIEESIIKRYKTDANDLKHNLDSWFSQKVNSYKELIKRNEIELSKHSQSRLDGEKVADTKRSSYKGAITRTIQKLDHLETVDYPKKLSEAEKISEIKCDKEYELIGILICIK